jgi:ketosteroid isomerase-like protein
MSTKLSSTLESYFAATNRRDIDAMIAAFANDATMKDEGQEHRGSAAIRDRMRKTIEKYDFKAEPTAVARSLAQTAVSVVLSGTFPGSPVAVTYWFKLDGQKIARLEIG